MKNFCVSELRNGGGISESKMVVKNSKAVLLLLWDSVTVRHEIWRHYPIKKTSVRPKLGSSAVIFCRVFLLAYPVYTSQDNPQ